MSTKENTNNTDDDEESFINKYISSDINKII